MENQNSTEQQDLSVLKTDYYVNKKRKVVDFLIGIFIEIIALVILTYLSFAVWGTSFPELIILVAFLILLILLVSVIWFFKSGRKFISLGIILGFIIIPYLGNIVINILQYR